MEKQLIGVEANDFTVIFSKWRSGNEKTEAEKWVAWLRYHHKVVSESK